MLSSVPDRLVKVLNPKLRPESSEYTFMRWVVIITLVFGSLLVWLRMLFEAIKMFCPT